MAAKKVVKKQVNITAPNMAETAFHIRGTAPLVQNKFSERALEKMAADQASGKAVKAAKEPKDFDLECQHATHISDEGWPGIPASAFRNGLIDTCRLLDFPMTRAKMAIFVIADGYERDRFGVQPLVRITKGEPKRTDFAVRNKGGVADIRPRPMWDPGWEAIIRLQFDQDQFSGADVANLLHRLGLQVGIGAGRPFSKESAGMGWGTFEILQVEKKGGRK